jgi:hypothetical protein
MARGRGRGGRTGRGRGRGAGQGGNSRPPAPPAPSETLNPQLLQGAAANLANINDSPASRTRRQCLIAIHGGANGASQSLTRTTTNPDDSDNDIVDDDEDLEDTPTRRMRQRREQLALATTRARTATNNYMRRLFAANTGDDDNGDPDYNPLEDEPTPAPVPAPARSPRQVQYGTNRVTSAGTDWLLEKCVKEEVFPKIKFAKLNGDLDFSNNPRSICRFMAQKMNVSDADVENWWETSKETVHTKLKVNRNNAIKAIKTKFQGKKEVPSDSYEVDLFSQSSFLNR